ncbi:hypothetical protein BO71DRAFT_428764 [Aspergillus ellipticus CBS 707.79]|uniref:Uncharacterized protein n=1 Tax=Aspergillus ellipticus CBS 707.79 TaxID=1448320 RepID=A0A319DE41_9EURO|nr:hypothetical protein BO71DRAFT_428764 [Aspergillus ellipticus CBS 707.79]
MPSFRDFFHRLSSYRIMLSESSTALQGFGPNATTAVTIPRKNWKVAGREESFTRFLGKQGMLLRALMEMVHRNLEGVSAQSPGFCFRVSDFRHKYVMGRKEYMLRALRLWLWLVGVCRGFRSSGYVMISLLIVTVLTNPVEWFEGQTWNESLADILSIMIGQLVQNISVGFQDQEVYVVGLHGPYVHVALDRQGSLRGMFSA